MTKPFKPAGYLVLSEAIDRVAEIKYGAEFAAELNDNDRIRFRYGECNDLATRKARRATQQHKAGDELRQLLYSGRIPFEVLCRSGSRVTVENENLGDNERWASLIQGTSAVFPYGYSQVSGCLIIRREDLEGAFDSKGNPAIEVGGKNSGRSPMRRHHYRTQLLDILDQVRNEIEETDFKERPPKKESFVIELQDRFGLSQREATTIATMIVPDERRGKPKKG